MTMLINRINNNKTITGISFEFKTKLIVSTPNDNDTLNAEVVVPLKYLRNFWILFDLPFINCEIELDLSSSKECMISEISITPKVRKDNLVAAIILCHLHHDYMKNYYRLITVYLSRQKQLNADPKAIQQIEFVWQLKNPDNATAAIESMLVLTILEKLKKRD